MQNPSCTHIQFRGADAIRLHGEGLGTVVVLLHGAHVVSWQDPSGTERMYLSPLSPLTGPAAVRGGVPVIFPQFAARGPFVRHGFARTQTWRIQPATPMDTGLSAATATLELTASQATRALWPHTFACELRVELNPWQLDLTFTARNPGETPWKFAAALHTYLAVPGLKSVELQGLQGLHFEDAQQPGAQLHQREALLQPRGEIDRIYFETSQPLRLSSQSTCMSLMHTAWRDTVVWNPGKHGAQALADLPDTDHDQFLCVEAAAIGEAIELRPGECWSGTQSLRVELPASTRHSVV
jgi:glucose-6-phosphate 1-epimerase